MSALDLTTTQVRHAKEILSVVRKRHLPKRIAIMAIETALAESQLRMYANGSVPESLQLPHEAVGWDGASVGLFQQQVGFGWGAVGQLMDTEYSTGAFLDRLVNVDWRDMRNWEACQHVQVSAYDGVPREANNFSAEFGGNYHAQDARARRIVEALWKGGAGPMGVLAMPAQPTLFWVDTFARAPVFTALGDIEATGELHPGRNYVFGKRWGKEVRTDDGFNHWWLKTDPDEGTGRWVSAYFLTHWGNDEARDNDGHDLPEV
jgi:hypothetical protein